MTLDPTARLTGIASSAAQEAARLAAEAAAQLAAEAAAQQAAEQVTPPVLQPADLSLVDGAAALQELAGPIGSVELPAAPGLEALPDFYDPNAAPVQPQTLLDYHADPYRQGELIDPGTTLIIPAGAQAAEAPEEGGGLFGTLGDLADGAVDAVQSSVESRVETGFDVVGRIFGGDDGGSSDGGDSDDGDDSDGGGLFGGLPDVGDVVGGVVDKAKDVVDSDDDDDSDGGGLFGGLGDVVGGVVDKASDVVDGATELHEDIHDTVTGTIGDIGSGVADHVSGIASDWYDGVSGAVESGIDTVDGVAENLREGDVLGALGDAVTGIGDTVTSGLGAASALNPLNLIGVQDDLTSLTNTALGGIRGGLNSAIQWSSDHVGQLGNDALSAIGLEGAGAAFEGATGHVGDFYQGITDGAASLVGGAANTFINPNAALQGIVHLSTHPDQIDDVATALWDEATTHGPAGAVGYTTATLLPTILSGGSTLAGTTASTLAKVGKVGRTADGPGPDAPAVTGPTRLEQLSGSLSSLRQRWGGIRDLTGHFDLRAARNILAPGTRPPLSRADIADLPRVERLLAEWQRVNPALRFDVAARDLLVANGLSRNAAQFAIDAAALGLNLNGTNLQVLAEELRG